MELAEELVPEGKRDKEECILLFESVLESSPYEGECIFSPKGVDTDAAQIPTHLIDEFTLQGLVPSLEAYILPEVTMRCIKEEEDVVTPSKKK